MGAKRICSKRYGDDYKPPYTCLRNLNRDYFVASEDLKYALRQSIELLGNEAAQYLIEHTRIGYTGKNALHADDLSRECLRYM